jgi:hypothetical protein
LNLELALDYSPVYLPVNKVLKKFFTFPGGGDVSNASFLSRPHPVQYFSSKDISLLHQLHVGKTSSLCPQSGQNFETINVVSQLLQYLLTITSFYERSK